ncbi:MAG: hypothetical protein J5685_02830 [Clostridiales bacterium]|nr:hypothetical protein [Clostridiales bacterium]
MFKDRKIILAMAIIAFTFVRLLVLWHSMEPAVDSSYERYLSGEYYFRARAVTVAIIDPMDTALDTRDQETLLKGSSGVTIYVCNPHVPFCTVYSNGNIYEDYPINGIRFTDEEEADIFYNRKVLTQEEYKDRLKGLKADSPLLSDPEMLNGKLSGNSTKGQISLIFFLPCSIGLAALIIFAYTLRANELFKLLWYIWAGLSIVFATVSIF